MRSFYFISFLLVSGLDPGRRRRAEIAVVVTRMIVIIVVFFFPPPPFSSSRLPLLPPNVTAEGVLSPTASSLSPQAKEKNLKSLMMS